MLIDVDGRSNGNHIEKLLDILVAQPNASVTDRPADRFRMHSSRECRSRRRVRADAFRARPCTGAGSVPYGRNEMLPFATISWPSVASSGVSCPSG